MKKPDCHRIFVNQMYNLVKSMAHPAGFEPTACRLGVLKKVLCQSSSEFFKALFFNAGSRQTAFWRSSEIVCFCLKNPSKIRWRLDGLRKLLGPFRRLTHFLDNRTPNVSKVELIWRPKMASKDKQAKALQKWALQQQCTRLALK